MILWTDLETTHLDPFADGASILEAAWVLTDNDLHELASASALIVPPGGPNDHDRLWASLDPFVQKMHRETGLWDVARKEGTPVYLVERQLTEWLASLGADRTTRYGGSGVAQFDVHWYRSHLPRAAAMLHPYQTIDVGQLRRAGEVLAGVGVQAFEATNPEPHRAMTDVRAALDQARLWRDLLSTVDPKYRLAQPSTAAV